MVIECEATNKIEDLIRSVGEAYSTGAYETLVIFRKSLIMVLENFGQSNIYIYICICLLNQFLRGTGPELAFHEKLRIYITSGCFMDVS